MSRTRPISGISFLLCGSQVEMIGDLPPGFKHLHQAATIPPKPMSEEMPDPVEIYAAMNKRPAPAQPPQHRSSDTIEAEDIFTDQGIAAIYGQYNNKGSN